jgi:hypothetical protein
MGKWMQHAYTLRAASMGSEKVWKAEGVADSTSPL